MIVYLYYDYIRNNLHYILWREVLVFMPVSQFVKMLLLEKRAIIHCNSVIGDDGFGYLQMCRHVKIPQVGAVEMGTTLRLALW